MILAFTTLSIWLGSAIGITSAQGKIVTLVLPAIILDPLLVFVTGGSLGHHLLGIRIVRADGIGKINFFAATARFLVKLTLGWLSFIFVLTTAKHQALHDLLSKSIVIYKNPDSLPSYEIQLERTASVNSYVYPSKWRRLIVIGLYWLFFTIATMISSFILLAAKCMEGISCTNSESVISFFLNIVWVLGLGWITVRGSQGRLLGCRRRMLDGI